MTGARELENGCWVLRVYTVSQGCWRQGHHPETNAAFVSCATLCGTVLRVLPGCFRQAKRNSTRIEQIEIEEFSHSLAFFVAAPQMLVP